MNCYWNQFADFTEEQFAANEYFQRWVLIPDEDTEGFWEGFIQHYPDQQIAVSNARKLVEHLFTKGFHQPNLDITERTELKAAIFNQIGHSVLQAPEIKLKKSSKRAWLVAASLAGFAALSAWLMLRTEPAPRVATILHSTLPKQVKQILLPDSSVVVLNGNSTIQYADNFLSAAQREITLTGNAFFRIKKTPTHSAFIVHTNEIDIRVTGTEFNVDARSAVTDVVLTEGSINISLAKDAAGHHRTYLKAGEKFRLDTLRHMYITEKADIDLYTAAWKNGEWHFDGTALEQVAQLINQFYGTRVIFKNKEAAQLMITAVVSVRDLSTLVHVIEKTLNLTIEETPDLLIVN